MFNNSGHCYNRGCPPCLDDEDHMCKQMAAGYSRHTWVVLIHLLILPVYIVGWVKIHQPEIKMEKNTLPKLSPVIEIILIMLYVKMVNYSYSMSSCLHQALSSCRTAYSTSLHQTSLATFHKNTEEGMLTESDEKLPDSIFFKINK